MERNIYAALLGVAALGFLIGAEWLFLTFILLAGGLFFAERFSSPAPSFENAAWSGNASAGAAAATTPQQPIVIQSGAHNPANTMMMDMISNLVQESSMYRREDSPFNQMQHHLDHKLSAIDSKLKKLDKKLAAAAKKDDDGHGGHGHH